MLAVGWVVGGYTFLVLLVFLSQRRMIYPAPRSTSQPNIGGARLVRREPSVCAVYVAAQGDNRTVVHFHGNGEELAQQGHLVRRLAAHGLGVYAIEYPGYGLLRDRSPNETAVYETAEAALRHLHDALGVPASRVVLQGQSLGTAVAIEMARRAHGSRLILISPFTSMTDMARHIAPWLPVTWLVLDRYDTAAKARDVALPALVIHGTRDDVVPTSMGRRVAELLPNADLVLVEGAGHNDLFAAGRERIWSEIAAFAAAD